MLWLLGATSILLILLIFITKRTYDRLSKILDVAGAISVQLNGIGESVHRLPSCIDQVKKDLDVLRDNSSSLGHLEGVPEIHRHLVAMRELTYGRKKTEHDSFNQWPSVTRLEQLKYDLEMKYPGVVTSEKETSKTDMPTGSGPHR
ncbi:MAG: hypothetical protein ACK5PF_01975 [bacterium]|jgi:hypothetical protein